MIIVKWIEISTVVETLKIPPIQIGLLIIMLSNPEGRK